jgi:hypothetical protein
MGNAHCPIVAEQREPATGRGGSGLLLDLNRHRTSSSMGFGEALPVTNGIVENIRSSERDSLRLKGFPDQKPK